MDLSTVQVSFKDAAGAVQQSRLDTAAAGVLAAGRPWRVFRWHRGQAHYSGWYWSATPDVVDVGTAFAAKGQTAGD